MSKPLSANAQKIQEILHKLGYSMEVVELPDSTHTAADAAQAIGCQIGQIVKSLIFKSKRTHRPILVIASGANRVNEKKIEAQIDEPLGKADADFVHTSTGFSIGGVAPIGHKRPLEIYIDKELLNYSQVWAAAGTPHAVFSTSPADLVDMTGGRVMDIT